MNTILMNALAGLLFITFIGWVLYEQRHRIRDGYTRYRLNKRAKASQSIVDDVMALTGFNREQLAAYSNIPAVLKMGFCNFVQEINTPSAQVFGYVQSQGTKSPVAGLDDASNLDDALYVLATHIGRDLTYKHRHGRLQTGPHATDAQNARRILQACAKRYGVTELTNRLRAA